MPGQGRKATKRYSLGVNKPTELELPSGNICLVERMGVRGLIKAGLMDSLDSLTGLVQKELIDSQDPKKQAQAALQLAEDPAKLQEGIDLIDRVICHVVKAPEVHMPPKEGERDPEKLYADDVDDDDKTFIFNFVVGGTRDIEQFRQERHQRLVSLSALQDVQMPPK